MVRKKIVDRKVVGPANSRDCKEKHRNQTCGHKKVQNIEEHTPNKLCEIKRAAQLLCNLCFDIIAKLVRVGILSCKDKRCRG